MAIIYLTGARGSGKTTIGKLLAKQFGLDFFDLDHCLVQKQNKTVQELVSAGGWEYFRRLESENLRAVTSFANTDAVLATGGGIVLDKANREFMTKNGIVLWLKTDEKILHERLCHNPLNEQRPSLTGKDMLAEIKETLLAREQLYASCATHIVDGNEAADTVCLQIGAMLGLADK